MQQYSNIKLFSTLFVIVVCIVVLTGWFLDVKSVLSIIPNEATMKVNTALGFLLLSAALLTSKPKHKTSYILSLSLTFLALLIGVYTQLSYQIQLPFSIDNIFITDIYSENINGRMSEATAFCLMVTGIGLLGSTSKKALLIKLSQHLLLLVTFISLISISTYILQIPIENKLFFINTMAIHTSSLFFILSIAISLNNPKVGFIGLLLGEYAGSSLLRKIMPLIVLLPLLLSYIVITLTQQSFFNFDFGVALYAILFIFISIIYLSAISLNLNKTDKKRKELETSLRSMVKEREQFVYIASHDLQEPLRTVSNFTKLLSEEYEENFDETGKKSIQFITAATQRMSLLIKGLLDYSRIGKDRKIAAVDLTSLINDIKQDLTSIITETGTHIEHKNLPTVEGNETELRLLFQNLILNAIKFRGENNRPFVMISAARQGTFFKLAIKDNGIGIEKKNLEKIFAIFQRLNSTKKYPGTGIGLAHCRKIVELHGGKIWAESTPGKGSIFYFTLLT